MATEWWSAPSAAVLARLASLVVHAQEALEKGHPLDVEAIRGLVYDEAVQGWLNSMPPELRPVKR